MLANFTVTSNISLCAATPVKIAAVNFVQKLGIRSSLSGYRLLITAIVTAFENPNLINSMTGRLYPMVAEYCGCSAQSVERNIRKAIESAYEYDPERIKSVFYYRVDKPYNSEVISMAVETIRYEIMMNNC